MNMNKTNINIFDKLLKRINELRVELHNHDLERYEYLNEEQRAELREKYRLLKDTRCPICCGKNSRISREFYEHYKKYKLLLFIYYDIPEEIDVSRLRLWK